MAGLVHLYCGDGKGKSTAAAGLALRAAGLEDEVTDARLEGNELVRSLRGLICPAEGELHPLPLGTALGILGPLRGEEGEEHLLHSVLICETVQV